jgi:alkanesulfonate monooxygenase SsuD/methylene tetrahydromethanopterin reductase-like flavin-dependent oxidoreductase (luciferase family)
MRYGVSMPNGGDPGDLVELAVTAEQSGWDGFFLWDHINAFPDTHDPWVLLGALAARTTRIRLGTLVTPVPRRRPWKLAKEVVTLDHLSGGRAVLGVGLGVPVETEYAAFGETTSVARQAAMLDEALPLLAAFLCGERVDHDGPHYTVHARLDPPAVQCPAPPVWAAVTAGRPGPLARARQLDGVFPLGGPAELAEVVAALDPPPGYDVVGLLGEDASADDLARAGATWVLEGLRSPQESLDAVRDRISAGPPTTR